MVVDSDAYISRPPGSFSGPCSGWCSCCCCSCSGDFGYKTKASCPRRMPAASSVLPWSHFWDSSSPISRSGSLRSLRNSLPTDPGFSSISLSSG